MSNSDELNLFHNFDISNVDFLPNNTSNTSKQKTSTTSTKQHVVPNDSSSCNSSSMALNIEVHHGALSSVHPVA